jgi:hypothetical protein
MLSGRDKPTTPCALVQMIGRPASYMDHRLAASAQGQSDSEEIDNLLQTTTSIQPLPVTHSCRTEACVVHLELTGVIDI